MIIYELLITVVILWIVSIAVRKDLFSPESLLCISYILAIVCAIYNTLRLSLRKKRLKRKRHLRLDQRNSGH